VRRTTPKASFATPVRPRGLSRARRRLAAITAWAFALLACTSGVAITGSEATAADTGPLTVVGTIPQPTGAQNGQNMIAIDPVGRRLYTGFVRRSDLAFMLGTYDLGTTAPTLLSQRVIVNHAPGDASPYLAFVESSRRRLYILMGGLAGPAGTSALTVVGLEGNAEATQTWDMATILPGFFAGGMTYSPEDDRIYMVGELSETMYITTSTETAGSKVVGGMPMVVAIDPADGKLLWARAVPECRFPLYTLFTGSLIARSSPRLSTPSLFFPCSPGGTLLSSSYPGQPGVAALSISPKATMADAPGFDVRYYPVSGNYFNGATTGIAGYDPGSDRLFFQSMSRKTPAAWVFDARADAWVGAITSPNEYDTWLGLNPRTGHYYMGGTFTAVDGPKDFILIADARTPRPQNGVLGSPALSPGKFILTDPVTDRVFIHKSTDKPVLVAKDTLESIRPRQPLDYDAQTDDIAESPASFVSFTGDAGGFGARFTAVGDTASVNGSLPLVGGRVPQATRAVTLARGPSSNLQPAGAAAAAAAAAVDTTTDQNLRENPPLPPWPYSTKTCLDGGDGISVPPEQTPTSYAAVTCNLQAWESASDARQSGASVEGVAVGDTRYQSKSKRTPKQGMSTESAAVTSGIHIDVPGAGSLDISRVAAKAITNAHGQSGTASASWSRAIEGVVVKDGTGKVVLQSPGCATTLSHNGKKLETSGSSQSCDLLAEAVRKALQVNVRLFFPVPAVVATAKGAFSSVGQTDVDQAQETAVNDQGQVYAGDSTTRRVVPALQIDIYHDSVERSRNIVQLAGVESASIFTVNKSPTDAPCDTGGCIPGGDPTAALPVAGPDASTGGALSVPSGADLVSTNTSNSSVTQPPGMTRLPSISGRVAQAAGLIFARRSLGQGVLMSAFLLLVGAALTGLARRRRLLDLLSSH
jgi:hypothetical protein